MEHGSVKVSVALCTYNGEPFVGQQLESVLKQSRPPDEIIVCDDGSTDRTLEIVKRVADSRGANLRMVQNPQTFGYIKNFERAMSEASGDVIFFSDQDDFWLEDRIARMLSCFAEDPGTVLVYCDAALVDAELRPTGATVFGLRSAMGIHACPTIRQIGRGLGFNGCMMAIRSRLRPFVVPMSRQWSHDHWIGFIAYAVGEVKPLPQALMYYRRHQRNDGADPDLDGGLWYRLRVAAQKSELKQYAHRCRRFNDMLRHLQAIRERGLSLRGRYPLEELLAECEACLQFARLREELKRRSRFRRIPASLRSLLEGDYHRHAHGAKSFIQDVAIP